MTKVKVCGVTRPEDATLAADLGASAIGMIFWPDSPRAVSTDAAKQIVASVLPFVMTVGVFVDQSPDEVGRIADAVGLDAIQLHGSERVDDYVCLGRRVIKAVGVKEGTSVADADEVPAHATILLDAHDPVKRGGTGCVIDWNVAAALSRRRRIVLSGGLHAGNVAAAVAAVTPYAVDVSSGVESVPGRKDSAKLQAFFAALRTL